MVGSQIGEASGGALQEQAAVSQHTIQPIEMRAQLIERVRQRRLHRGGIDIPTGESGPVFQKSLGQRVGSLREHNVRGLSERGLLGPPGKRVGCAVAGRKKGRAGAPALDFAHDQLTIAINVRADLQHRRLAIASRQRRQVGFRHDGGDLDRSPRQTLEAKTEPDFLRIGGGPVVMQDDIGHRDGPRFGVIRPPRYQVRVADRQAIDLADKFSWAKVAS